MNHNLDLRKKKVSGGIRSNEQGKLSLFNDNPNVELQIQLTLTAGKKLTSGNQYPIHIEIDVNDFAYANSRVFSVQISIFLPQDLNQFQKVNFCCMQLRTASIAEN